MKKVLAIIPARSGSKGLPDKNILPLKGKPLMAYTIEAARQSGLFSRVVVSTDSENYKTIAQKYGAEVPLLRPKDIAGDNSAMSETIFHLVDYYKAAGEIFDLIVLLQPTSPLRTSHHIKEAMEKYDELAVSGNETLVSVVKAPAKSKWLMSSSGSFVDFCFDVNKQNPQRQALSDLFFPNGAIYIAPAKSFNGSFYTDKTLFYEMEDESSVDIDSSEDFKIAELKIKELTR